MLSVVRGKRLRKFISLVVRYYRESREAGNSRYVSLVDGYIFAKLTLFVFDAAFSAAKQVRLYAGLGGKFLHSHLSYGLKSNGALKGTLSFFNDACSSIAFGVNTLYNTQV